MTTRDPRLAFGRDRGLQARMLTTMVGLGVLYGLLVVGLFLLGAHALIIAARLRAGRRLPGRVRGQGRARRRRRAAHDPRAGARPARGDRAALHPGRHPQAEDRGRRHRHAERVRHRAQPQVRDHLRHDRAAQPAGPGRARGRPRARARAREEPRRARDDDRLVRRERRPADAPALPVLDPAVLRLRRARRRHLLHRAAPAARALPPPRVRRRPHRVADDRPPERARLRAREGVEPDGADPDRGPAGDAQAARRSSSSPPTRTRSSAASSPPIRRSRTGSAR